MWLGLFLLENTVITVWQGLFLTENNGNGGSDIPTKEQRKKYCCELWLLQAQNTCFAASEWSFCLCDGLGLKVSELSCYFRCTISSCRMSRKRKRKKVKTIDWRFSDVNRHLASRRKKTSRGRRSSLVDLCLPNKGNRKTASWALSFHELLAKKLSWAWVFMPIAWISEHVQYDWPELSRLSAF